MLVTLESWLLNGWDGFEPPPPPPDPEPSTTVYSTIGGSFDRYIDTRPIEFYDDESAVLLLSSVLLLRGVL